MLKQILSGAVVAVALTAAASNADAQSLLGSYSRGSAIALNAGSYINFYDYGDYRTFRGLRLNPELQFHGRGAYAYGGAAIGVDMYPGYYNMMAIGMSVRGFYDIPVISGAAFYLSPYIGATFGAVLGNNAGFFVSPSAGLELKLVLVDRVLLGFRPIGIGMPIVFNQSTNVNFGYDAAVTLGITF